MVVRRTTLLAVLAVTALSPAVLGCGGPERAAAGQAEAERDIVFAAAREGEDIEIWRMRPDGSNPRPLTDNEDAMDNFPVWSPDGTQIAFLSTRGGSSGTYGDIHVMNADGSSVRKVGPDSPPFMVWPEWSPDGSEILFSAGKGVLTDLDLYVTNADGSAVRQLTSGPTADRCPSWGPEGDRIIYTAESEDGEATRLMLLDRGTGKVEEVLPNGIEGRCAYWAPDGDRVAFSSGPDGDLPSLEAMLNDGPGVMEIYLLDLRTDSVTQITEAGAISNYPRWSRDGRRIVFQSTRGFDGPFMENGNAHYEWFDVYTMNPDGTDVTRLTANETFDAHPNW